MFPKPTEGTPKLPTSPLITAKAPAKPNIGVGYSTVPPASAPTSKPAEPRKAPAPYMSAKQYLLSKTKKKKAPAGASTGAPGASSQPSNAQNPRPAGAGPSK